MAFTSSSDKSIWYNIYKVLGNLALYILFLWLSCSNIFPPQKKIYSHTPTLKK